MNTNTTPQPIDSFSRWMAGIFDERQVLSVPTGFQAFFGNPGAGSMTHFSPDANVVDIDIIRGNKKTAALIPRGAVSRPLGSTQKDMQTGKYTSFSRKFPLSEESGNISADEILYRLPGESPYSTETRVDRMRTRARDIHLESVRRHVRLFEILAASSILTGTMPAILGTANTDLIYDFKRKNTHTLVVDTAWNNAAGDVMGDLETACELIEQDASLPADFFGIGGQAMSAMIHNEAFQTLADNRRIEFIQVSMDLPVPKEFARFVRSGWLPQGCLRTPKGYTLWVFTYNRTYQDSDGTPTKLMPEDQAIITSSRARCDRYFGPPETIPSKQKDDLYMDLFGFDPKVPPIPVNILNGKAVVDGSMFHCDAYMSNDAKRLTIRTQSAPIFATTQTDAFATLTGLCG